MSGLIQASQVSSPVVGMERPALEGTVKNWLDPLKSAARFPLGRLAEPGVPPRYVPLIPCQLRSGSLPEENSSMAKYRLGRSARTTAS